MFFSFSLSDSQWEGVANLLPACRKRKYSVRRLFTAMVYVCKTGCQWRSLPGGYFPPWPIVYYYFRGWSRQGCLEKAMQTLTRQVRLRQGKQPRPTTAIIDAQSVRTAAGVSEHKGWDGARKWKGRKRHLLTDSDGLPLGITVGNAAAPDRAGLLNLQADIEGRGLQRVYADQGYVGIQLLKVPVLIVRQLPKAPNRNFRQPVFQVLPKRWVIERTFAWLSHYRRLSRDYEKRIDCSRAMIQIALINILSARLAGKT